MLRLNLVRQFCFFGKFWKNKTPLFFHNVASLCYFWHKNLVFLENEQQIRGKGNEGESQNPHQTLVIINIAKPML